LQQHQTNAFDEYGRFLDQGKARVLSSASSRLSAAPSPPSPTSHGPNDDDNDVDWAGLKAKRAQKVHFPHTQESTLDMHPLAGLTSRVAEKVGHRVGKAKSSATTAASTSLLLASPEARDMSTWTTSYQAQADRIPTPAELFDPLKRIKKVGKKMNLLATVHQQAAMPLPPLLPSTPVSAAPVNDDDGTPQSLIGYRAPPANRGGKVSFLAGMGKEICESGKFRRGGV
jgi:hypothetical protein